MVNKCELSANRRHSQQAKDADRLEPKGTWSVQGLKTSLSWTHDRRRIERTSPTLADKRNTVSPYCCSSWLFHCGLQILGRERVRKFV
jgi:hypothetical protein